MPLPPLGPPPRGSLDSAEGRRWLDLLYRKVGSYGQIPTESVSPAVAFNNANNARVRWFDVNAAGGRVQVDGPTDGASWSRYEGDDSALGYRTIGPFPATQFTGKAYNLYYYVTYDPKTALYACVTDFRLTLKEGLYTVGSCNANASFGGAGATTGGGGSATAGDGGSVGGSGEAAPGIRVGGYGRLL